MKTAYAIVDLDHDLMEYVVFGPLTEDETIRIPSQRLIWVGDSEGLDKQIENRFEVPIGFVRHTKLSRHYISQEHYKTSSQPLNQYWTGAWSISKVIKQQLGIEVPDYSYRNRNELPIRPLNFQAILKYWLMDPFDKEVLLEVARKVPVLCNMGWVRQTRVTRRQGYVVDNVSVSGTHYALVRYDLAAWTEATEKNKKAKSEHKAKEISPKILTIQAARDLYWGMAHALGAKIRSLTPKPPSFIWCGPGAHKHYVIESIVGLYKTGQKLFGPKFWPVHGLPDCTVRGWRLGFNGVKGSQDYNIIMVLRDAHNKNGLKRPPAKQRYARMIWDLIHQGERRSPVRTGSAKTSSRSPSRTRKPKTGRRTSGLKRKTVKTG